MKVDVIIKILVAVIGLIKVIVDALSDEKTEGGGDNSKK
jgi:hypothetical protein